MDIRVPSLGEGIESGSIVSIVVSVGEKVEKDQTLVEIETEKAVAPLPSPAAGTVEKIHVKEGDKVAVGQVILSLAGVEEASPRGAAPPAAGAAVMPPEARPGYRYQSPGGFPPPAGPAVRKLARDLGVDLTLVMGSARGGRITVEDVKRFAPSGRGPGGMVRKPVDFSKWGPVSKKRLTPLRKTVGERMVESWTEVPHVTQFADADITGLTEMRKRHVARFKKKGGNLTVTVFAIKVVLDALKKYPLANASLDEAAEEIVLKNYYHIGIAVDTEAGLIVPVLKDVDKKKILDLSVELVGLAEKARKRKLTLEELQGASFTISNLGSIGGAHFTPIVYKPQVAILGIGRGSVRAVWTGKRFEPRTLLPLALSYDHRVIDGADGARFISEIVSGFENFDEKFLRR